MLARMHVLLLCMQLAAVLGSVMFMEVMLEVIFDFVLVYAAPAHL